MSDKIHELEQVIDAERRQVSVLRLDLAEARGIVNKQATQIADLDSQLSVMKGNLEEVTRIRDLLKGDLQAMETATLRYYAFASDEAIAEWAQKQPNEQAKKIADLTFRLRREMAGKQEVANALSVMVQRMKTKRAVPTEAEFGERFSS